MIDFISRTGLARHGSVNNFSIPNIAFAGDYSPEGSIRIERNENILKIAGMDVALPGLEEIRELELGEGVLQRGDLVILPGLITLIKNPRELVKKILTTRKEVGLRKIIYAPGIALPGLVPILHYLGIDILDDLRCMITGSCQKELWSMEMYVRKSRTVNDMRVLVESVPDPLSKTLLRLSDTNYYDEMEIFFPVTGNFLNASHFESLFRPDIQRWLKRITEIYEKPESETVALLLPCSATKPYSKSRSHRFYRSILERSGKHVHELIVTSPLGIVPRELEFTYPAKNYDVPVTGYWYEDEKKMLIKALEKFLARNRYEKIIAYLPDDLDFLSPYLDKINADFVIGNLRDDGNVKRLLSYLEQVENKKISWDKITADRLNSISMFQFGEKFPLENKRFRKRFDEIFVYENNDQYLYFSPAGGNLLLYRKSALHLLERNKYTVEIDNFVPRGSVFVAGIKDASREIRAGDEVVIHSQGRLIGTGTALMSFKDMLEQERGEAIKVRHTFIS